MPETSSKEVVEEEQEQGAIMVSNVTIMVSNVTTSRRFAVG